MAVMLGNAPLDPASPEQDLIEATRDGDDRAFEELYARYRDQISAFIRRRVADQGRAEDVAQEVFISALRRLRASGQGIVFKPWIYEIAKNACIDEHRRDQRNREVSLDADADLAGGHRAPLSVAAAPPAVLEGKEKFRDLRGAMRGLSDNHQQLLVMREFEGLSYDEIGTRTGMSRQMVESALFRARRKLSAEYDELTSGRRCLQVQSAIESGRMHGPCGLGVRERRQFNRHLAHCQPCRVQARLAGLEKDLSLPRRVGSKIAALLPFPLWRLWPGSRGSQPVSVRAGSHPLAGPAVQLASAGGEPGASSVFGGAAIAAAAIAIVAAGSGGGASRTPSVTHVQPAAQLIAPGSGGGPLSVASPLINPAAAATPGLRGIHVISVQSEHLRRVGLRGRRPASRTRPPTRSPGGLPAPSLTAPTAPQTGTGTGVLPGVPAAPAPQDAAPAPGRALGTATRPVPHDPIHQVISRRGIHLPAVNPDPQTAAPPAPAAVNRIVGESGHRLAGAVPTFGGLVSH